MGSTLHSTDPGIRLDTDPSHQGYVMPASPRPTRVTRHVVLFVLTFITTTLAGTFFYGSYASELGNASPDLSLTSLLLHGLWYSGSVVAILGAHEFGHYFACRYYGVDASLPYFIPLWLPLPVPMPGTLGAVIRIRQPIAIQAPVLRYRNCWPDRRFPRHPAGPRDRHESVNSRDAAGELHRLPVRGAAALSAGRAALSRHACRRASR